MTESTPSFDDEQYGRALARVGTKLGGKWTLQRILGIGGMAAVFEAEHDNGRRVAIKVLHPELCQVAEARERFLDEAYIANHVLHSGTVPALDDGITDDSCPFLVMEYLEGETLQSLWQRSGKALPALEVFQLMLPLLDILRASHEKGIVHRDIKPDNIFLTVTGEIKLLDFGIARMAESQRHLKTQFGAAMGTPEYMAPEQARGRWEEVDEQSDIWSLGATMFALVCDRTVHQAERTNELLLASMTQHAPRVLEVAADVPEMAASVIDKALAFEKTDRYANAEEMLSEVLYVTQVLEGTLSARTTSAAGVASVAVLPSAAVLPSNAAFPSTAALLSLIPRSTSTFRSVTDHKPALKRAHKSLRERQRQKLLATTALAMTAVMGYSAAAHLAGHETAWVAATQQPEAVDISDSDPISETASETSLDPVTERPQSGLSVISFDRAIESAPRSTVTASGEEVAKNVVLAERIPKADRALLPVKPATARGPLAPAKKTASRDKDVNPRKEETRTESFDPLKMRR